MVQMIQEDNTSAFIKLYNSLKAKADIREKRDDVSDISANDQFNVAIEDLQLFRYLGHQIEANQ